MILVGVADWAEKPAPPAGRGEAGGRGVGPAAPAVVEEQPPHPRQARSRTLTCGTGTTRGQSRSWRWPPIAGAPAAVWHVATNKLVVVGKSFDESVSPSGDVAGSSPSSRHI
jgi:hypothetical protein